MNRTARWMAFAVAVIAALVCCSSGRTAPASRKTLALLAADSGPYREMLAGFQARANGEVEVEVMGADDAALASAIAADPPALIFAIGSSAADFALRQSPRVPVLFSMVYYPEQHGLVGRENVAGLSLRVPPAQVLAALDMVRPDPTKKLRVGVLYPEDKEGPELDEIRAALAAAGHRLVLGRVGPGRDAGQAFAALLPEIDVLWLVADPVALPGPDFLASVLRVALDKKVAVIGLSETHVRGGALLAVSVDYRLEGQTAARLAARLRAGEKPSAIGVMPPQNLVRSLNTKVAEELGWPVLRSTRQRFERVYP